ncbi:MAG: hypothetical protein QXM81_02705 [Nitrososphaerota archaeon]
MEFNGEVPEKVLSALERTCWWPQPAWVISAGVSFCAGMTDAQMPYEISEILKFINQLKPFPSDGYFSIRYLIESYAVTVQGVRNSGVDELLLVWTRRRRV